MGLESFSQQLRYPDKLRHEMVLSSNLSEEINVLEHHLFSPIPDSRNFEIKVQDDSRAIRVALQHDDGREFMLNLLLPTNASFLETENYFGCQLGFRQEHQFVCFPHNSTQCRGFLLGLMHEVGHANLPLAFSESTLKGLAASADPEAHKRLHEIIKANERMAWSYGLEALRELERAGFTVFGGFENTQQIRTLVALNLLTYEWASQVTLTELEKQGHRG